MPINLTRVSNDSWVTVLTFTAPHEAYIAKAYLESHAIECFLRDENLVSVHPFYSTAVGGVKLQVKTSDQETAKSILIDGGYNV